MLYSSFTPFIVIFLHAIASSSLQDTQLLEDIVRTLDPLKNTSKASSRLCEICTIFSRVARGLVQSRHSFLGTYNPQNDSLLLLNDTSQTSVFNPGSLQDYFEAEVDSNTNMLDRFTYAGRRIFLLCWGAGRVGSRRRWIFWACSFHCPKVVYVLLTGWYVCMDWLI